MSARPYQTPRFLAEARQLTIPGVSPRTKDWGHDALCSRRGKSHVPRQPSPDGRQSAFHTPSLHGAAASGPSGANSSRLISLTGAPAPSLGVPRGPDDKQEPNMTAAPAAAVEEERGPIGIEGWDGSDDEDSEEDVYDSLDGVDETANPNSKVAWQDLEPSTRRETSDFPGATKRESLAPSNMQEPLDDSSNGTLNRLKRTKDANSTSVLQATLRGFGNCCKPVIDCAEACVEDVLGLDTVKRRARLLAAGYVIHRGTPRRRPLPRW